MQTVELDSLVAAGAPIIYGILMPGDHVPGGVPVVKVRNFEDGRLDLASLLRTTPEIDAAYRRSRLRAGDILLSIRGTTGRVAVVPDELEGGNITQDSARIRIEDCSLRDYVAHVLTSPFVQNQIALHTVGQAVKGINIASVRKLRVPIPVVRRRHVLTRLFDALKASEHMLADVVGTKRRLKRAMLQQLRLKSSSWRAIVLEKIAAPVTRKNSGASSRVLTASGAHGLVDQRRYFNKSVAGESLNGYCLLKRGEFAYNRSAMKGYPFGAVKMLEGHNEGVVSTLYICFSLTSDRLSGPFLSLLFESGAIDRQLRSIVHVGGRAHGLLNVTRDDFFGISVPDASPVDQVRFCRAAKTLDHEIGLLERQLAAYRQLKRGLMQQLLTGEIGAHSGIDVLPSTADGSVESGLNHQ